MTFKSFIFDLDGTLVNSAPDLANAVNEMRRHYHLAPLDKQTVISYTGDGSEKLVERSLRQTDIDCIEALDIFLEAYKKVICKETHFYDHVVDFLNELLSKDIPALVLTNKPQDMADLLLEKLKASHYFKHILGPGVYGKKPDPGGLNKCLELVNLPPEEVIMIGDHHTDIFAANQAGVTSVFLTYGLGQIGTAKADYTFDTFEELFRFL